MMIGVCPPCRSTVQRSKPLALGSIRSSTTKSGESVRDLTSAASPSPAHSTSNPSYVRLSLSTLASAASSSTMRIRLLMFPRDGDYHTDSRPLVDDAADRQVAAVIGDDALHDGEPQPSTVRYQMAPSEELSCHVLDLVFRNPSPLIGHIEHDVTVLAMGRDMEMAA